MHNPRAIFTPSGAATIDPPRANDLLGIWSSDQPNELWCILLRVGGVAGVPDVSAAGLPSFRNRDQPLTNDRRAVYSAGRGPRFVHGLTQSWASQTIAGIVHRGQPSLFLGRGARYPKDSNKVKPDATFKSMRSPNKKPEANLRQARVVSENKKSGATSDLDSQQMKAIGKGLGNSEFDKQLGHANGQRDALLAHIIERLETVHGAQNKERMAMGREREWFKAVAKGVEGYHLPDPTRWHECAQFYMRAAEALCNGNLGRGAQLLQRAADAEQAAFESVPKMVKSTLERDECAVAAPQEVLQVNDEAGCSARDRPQGLSWGAKVLAVQDKMAPTPPLKVKQKRNWWEEEEEEEEEEETDD